MDLEVMAMNAVKGVFEDAGEQYTVQGESDRKLAMELVFGSAYNFGNSTLDFAEKTDSLSGFFKAFFKEP